MRLSGESVAVNCRFQVQRRVAGEPCSPRTPEDRRAGGAGPLKSPRASPIFKPPATTESQRRMFANAVSRRASNAYLQVGVETSVSSASPHRLVAMLFDALSDALARARGAMQAGQIAEKGQAIGHAVRIVEEGLRSSLNLDKGGAIAADLNRLYGYLAARLTHANLHNDAAALQECSDLIEPVRSAWLAIDPARAA